MVSVGASGRLRQLKTWWYLTKVNEKKTNKQTTFFRNSVGNKKQLLPGASWQSQTDLFAVLNSFFTERKFNKLQNINAMWGRLCTETGWNVSTYFCKFLFFFQLKLESVLQPLMIIAANLISAPRFYHDSDMIVIHYEAIVFEVTLLTSGFGPLSHSLCLVRTKSLGQYHVFFNSCFSGDCVNPK